MYREGAPAKSLSQTESVVGQSVLRKEGQAKILGEAKYVDDLTYPEMLYGKTVRSTIARGIIKEINFDPIFDWGQVVVADYRDISGRNVVALIEDDQPLLAEREVRHHAEPVLLLACKDREMLAAAEQHVQIIY